jgi:hypothetical protein
MSIAFQRKGVCYQGVWFVVPIAAGQDIFRSHHKWNVRHEQA